MTSAAKNNPSPRGFTLMEIIMVIAIASMVMAGAIGVLVFNSSERELRSATSDLEVLAKRARVIAMLQQRPYALEFSPGVVRLYPYAEALQIQADPSISRTRGSMRSSHSTGNLGAAEEPEEVSPVEPVYSELFLEPNLALELRRWASEKWVRMDEKRPQIWRFDPDGVCEPITVRISNNEESWIESTFHPLTATVSDQSSEIR